MSDIEVKEDVVEQASSEVEPLVEMKEIDFTQADYIIAKLAEARKENNREIRKVYKELESRVTEQLPKGYKISLELESISNCTHPRLKAEGPLKAVVIDINQKKFNIHEALAKSIRWACKDLGERKVARIWKNDESNTEAARSE